MTLAEYLTPYKQRESAESAVLIIDDRYAQMVLAYWPRYPLPWSAPRGSAPEEMGERWDWLWSGIPLNHELISAKTGVAKNLVGSRLEILQANYLIYPDRSISQWGSKILQAEVALRYDPRKR